MDFPASWIATLTPRNSNPFELTALMPDNPLTVVTIYQVALFARGTKVFTAVR